MEPNIIIAACVGIVIGGLVGFFADRMRQGAAYQRRDELIDQAKREAENVRKTEELASKEILLKRRQELEEESTKARDQLRDVERKLDKRETVVDERHQDHALTNPLRASIRSMIRSFNRCGVGSTCE